MTAMQHWVSAAVYDHAHTSKHPGPQLAIRSIGICCAHASKHPGPQLANRSDRYLLQCTTLHAHLSTQDLAVLG